MGTTAAAAAVVIARENDIVAHFRGAEALSAATAKSATELGVDKSGAWIMLERRGIIRAAGEARYYLDEVAWAANRARRKRAAVMLIVVALALGIMALGVLAAIWGFGPRG